MAQQASTYDQGAVGLLALHLGDTERAKQILQFFRRAWDEAPQRKEHIGRHGLANFFNVHFGTEGIEKTVHVGPNAWVGLFAARYGNALHDEEATRLALDIAYWIRTSVPHRAGAVAMSSGDSGSGAPGSNVLSTENNISYYAFLTELLRCPRLEKEELVALTEERDHVEGWLFNSALNRNTYKLIRGITLGGPDRIQALDTATWFLSAIGPKRLAARGIDPYQFMKTAEKSFEVSIDDHLGVDPTDQAEADIAFMMDKSRKETASVSRSARDKHRMIWYEGLGQYILAWGQIADWAAREGRRDVASEARAKIRRLTESFDQAALARIPGQAAYPYATNGRFFRDGWRTQLSSDQTPASSLIAAAWRCFAGLGIDPVAGTDLSYVVAVKIPIPADEQLAQRPSRPTVLYGTSEDMTLQAWRALNRGDLDAALAQAQATIDEWSGFAVQLQERKMREFGSVIDYSGKELERRNIFKFWALNDVAACCFIKGKVLDIKKDYPQAAQAFQQVVNHYSLAQIWDPQGWFWAPADAVKDEYVLADASHYGGVMPEVLADGFVTGRSAN
ncbi:MAG: hypothetical protein WC859_04870 [Elusimicrobiota bacterium]